MTSEPNWPLIVEQMQAECERNPAFQGLVTCIETLRRQHEERFEAIGRALNKFAEASAAMTAWFKAEKERRARDEQRIKALEQKVAALTQWQTAGGVN